LLIDSALHALTIVFDPSRFAIICFGVVLGLVVGVIPGIGGLAGMALLIPFTYSMDPHTALAFIVGMWAVTATSDTVPAILFGVPGAVGSAATVLDGYPMAKRGEAGRAFGASFTSSIIGGLFGAILLAIAIPILRPFMLAIGTPELLAVCVLGLTLIASVSQGAVLKGLVTAVFGVILAAIGEEAQSGTMRWTGDILYLWEGLPIEPMAVGLFAIPELLSMAIVRRNVAGVQRVGGMVREQLRGVRDVMQNWKVVLNSSVIGVVLGSVPGMGSAVIDWIAYGSAARMLKGASETFGKGDVRGLIAAESANNAREGGALLPTLAFGVPSSPSMALLLGAFLAHGITPGQKLLTTQLDITYTLVWSLALANVFGASLCFVSASQLAKLATIRAGILVPTVLAVSFVGAYQGSRSFGDLVVLLVFGLIGWIMKQFGWARAPLILGYILGKLIEKYLFISMGRYQFEWLHRPGVIGIFIVTLLVLARPALTYLYQVVRPPRPVADAVPVGPAGELAASPAIDAEPEPLVDRIVGPGLWVLATLGFGFAFWAAIAWPLAARLMPQTAAAAGLVVIVCSGITVLLGRMRGEVMQATRATHDIGGGYEGLSQSQIYGRLGVQVLWLVGLLLAVLVIGMLPALALFMFLYMVIQGATRWTTALFIVVPILAGMYLLFVKLLHVPWPPSLLGDMVPALRAFTSRML
jgi:TctA family transporter